MIDCRLLMIGNNVATDENNIMGESFSIFQSNCYFDWMSLTKISLGENSIEGFFQEWYKLYSKKREESLNGYHIQQSFMLISDVDNEDDNESFEEAPLLYVSLVSLSCTTNSVASFKSIKNILIDSGVQGVNLYHCLDHCNYVLVCDGIKTRLEDYLRLLMRIKNMRNHDNEIIVNDITTLYGCNFDRLRNISSKETIRLILSINKAGENSLVLAENIDQLHEKWENIFNCVGRYDHILVSKPLSWRDFSLIAEIIRKNRTRMLATRIHICLESKDETLNDLIDDCCGGIEFNNKDTLIEQLETFFYNTSKSIYDKISSFDLQTATQIKYALHEVYYSICAMLRRAFSNYFVLCFYESFSQLLEYIDKKLLSKSDMSYKDIDYYSEKIYDLINSYFIYLRTLVASTLHNERRFIQADPHQLTYFDIPPKLIAFYTAFARKMSDTLCRTSNSKSKYTFLIVPDFKKDIYVESLTQNRDFHSELNILIIHINEKSMYDISQTTKILAHEIAHHTGLDCESRMLRAYAYMKCILANIICINIDVDIYKTTNRDNWQNLFNSIINVFIRYIEQFFKIDELIETDRYDPKYVYTSTIPKYYYSRRFIREYDRFLFELFQDDEFWNDISDKLFEENLPWSDFSKYFESDKGSTLTDLSTVYNEKNRAFLKKYAINKFIDNLRDKILLLYKYNELDSCYDAIEYAFREGVADIQMLCLISSENASTKDVDKIYADMFSVLTGRYEQMRGEVGIRQLAVRSTFADEILYNDFDEVEDDDQKNAKAYLNYLLEQLISFFKSITPMKNFFDNGKKISGTFSYEKIISSFLKSHPDVDEMVEVIDSVIDEYQHSL